MKQTYCPSFYNVLYFEDFSSVPLYIGLSQITLHFVYKVCMYSSSASL